MSSHTSAGSRLTKPSGIPHTPLIPVFGHRVGAQQHQRAEHAAAFSLNGAQGPFSFISDRLAMSGFNRPDVPKPSAQTNPGATRPQAAALQPNEAPEMSTATGKPRFRSALEQVSYFTNQSVMRE